MAATALLLLLVSTLLFIPSNTRHPPSHFRTPHHSQSFTSIHISQHGLDFVKNLLINKAISSIIPLRLPEIENSVKIPFLGHIDMVLSNITIYNIDVSSSYVKPGDTGVNIVASGITCNLSMNWYYSYSTWVFPVEISDQGRASVQVEDMEVGLTLSMENHGGTLKLSLVDSGCYVKDIFIKLDGGASWLYQGMIDAFKEQIGDAVESAITKKTKDGILKLDSFLQGLPKEIPVDDNAMLNVTFVNDPVTSNNTIDFDINGLFTPKNKAPAVTYHHKNSMPSILCTNQTKMLGISVDEAVFNSASALYYNADFMQWVVDEVPDQSLLNTAGWRFIVPQLYKKYPNDDMNLNISLSSPPVISISERNIDATIYAELVIDVLESQQVIPVICISLVMHGSGSVKVIGNNLGGSVNLDDFAMSLKWSKVGNLHMYLIQPVMWTLIKTVFVPYANKQLEKGFPLPIIHGFTLQTPDVIFSNAKVTVCSDVAYVDSDTHNLLAIHLPEDLHQRYYNAQNR